MHINYAGAVLHRMPAHAVDIGILPRAHLGMVGHPPPGLDVGALTSSDNSGNGDAGLPAQRLDLDEVRDMVASECRGPSCVLATR